MRIPSLLCFIMLYVINVNAQRLITIQSGSNVFQYTSIDSALINAVAGDQIYIPGGTFNVNNLVLNKSVMIFGTGHYPDSTLATGTTRLIGNLFLVTGSSGGVITGCEISGNVVIGNGIAGSDSVSNYTILRCSIENLYFSSNGMPPSPAYNFSVGENIIRGNISGADAQNINFSKNIIQGGVKYFNGNVVFSNNDFTGLGDCVAMPDFISDVSGCTFHNNVILYVAPACSTTTSFFAGNSGNNVFSNNLFSGAINFPNGTNTGNNNIISQPVNSIFVNSAGGAFSYSQDYHLKPTSPGKNAGTDGFDIGIYGSTQPYKTGGVPFNPHVQQKSIDAITDSQGQLNIQIRVAAQDH